MAITQILRGDATGAVKAIQDLNKAIDGTEKEYAASTKEAKKLDAQARRVAENADPQKRYNRQMQDLAQLVKLGKVELSAAEKVAAKYGERLRRAETAGSKAFGSQALSGIRSFALQYVGLSQALNAVVQGFRDVAAEREKTQQAALEARAGVGELSQLAATTDDPEGTFKALVAEARAVRASGAADSQQDAANQLFSLVSAGLERSDRDFAFQLRGSGVLQNVGGAATAFAALQTALGKEEVGSFEDFISKALQASSIAPALANEIPQAAARAGGSASALGLSDEFLNAAVAILGKKSGSAAEGGTQLASFLKQVEKAIPDNEALRGKRGIELVEFLSTLSEEEQGFGGILGDRAEAISGFRTLRDNIVLLADLTKQIDAADDNGLARRAVALPGTDDQQRAALAKARATGSLEVSLGDRAALQNLVDAAILDRQKTFEQEGTFGPAGPAILGIDKAGINLNRTLGVDTNERDLRNLLPDVRDPKLLQDIADALGDQTIVLNRIADQQRTTVLTGRSE